MLLVRTFDCSSIQLFTFSAASVCAAGDSFAYQRSTVFGDDVVVVTAYRTPLCKSKRGGLKDTYPDDILAPVLKACLSACVLAAWMAAFYAGFPGEDNGTSLRLSFSNGDYIRKCFTTLWRNEEGTRSGCAVAATAFGKFKDEIIPVKTKIVDPKTGEETPVTISVDDGIRPGTTLAYLAKLKPVFKKDGSTTTGTSIQVSDGVGAVLLMKRSLALQKGLPILGVFRTFAAVGVPPAIMGIGPAVAIPAAVKAAGLEGNDIDLFEIN
ncbi:3-ketoacyl-CoA thiolase 2, peroxisomal [Tanacetum coccineum]